MSTNDTTKIPQKIAVHCSATFCDKYLAPVAQRAAQTKAGFFVLESRPGGDVYTFRCYLNPESLSIQKDCVISDDLMVRITVFARYSRRIGKASIMSFNIIDTTPFRPTHDAEQTVPAYFHTFAEIKSFPATIYTIAMKCGDVYTGISLAVPVADMLAYLENVRICLAQSVD